MLEATDPPGSRHYGYAEVRSATTKSGRRKIARPVVAAISQNSVAARNAKSHAADHTVRAASPRLSVASLVASRPGSSLEMTAARVP
jgi:hypothetical protein